MLLTETENNIDSKKIIYKVFLMIKKGFSLFVKHESVIKSIVEHHIINVVAFTKRKLNSKEHVADYKVYVVSIDVV